MKSTELFCHKMPKPQDPRRPYNHFFPSEEAVKMCGTYPIVKVLLTEAPEEAQDADCYWAWWDTEHDHNRFCMVWAWRGGVEMCFPYGTEIAERLGRGMVVRVLVQERSQAA